MCGIAGKISFNDEKINFPLEKPLILKVLDKLRHRGPDDSGYYTDGPVWLASTRLSIIDLSPLGHQPMINENGNLIMVFNGEIYNYLQIKNKLKGKHLIKSGTDSEIVIHLYEEYGAGCLKYLRGMFAFAIWDKRKRELFIARDRLGKKPLKYFFNGEFLIFASELKSFIDYPGVKKEIDWEAVDEFLTYQYVPAPKTGFKDIYKLPPAHYMVIKPDGKMIIRKYWDLDFSEKFNYSDDKWVEVLEEKLKESVKIRLRSDVPLGVHLSGGIDSGLVTAMASLQSGKKLDTFSIGFDDEEYNELKYAKSVSDKYSTNHHEFIVKPDIIGLLPKLSYDYEEPFADPSTIPTYYLMKETKKTVTVVLNGDGGDENFAGYRRYSALKSLNLFKNIPLRNPLRGLTDFLYRLVKKRGLHNLSDLLNKYSGDQKIFYRELVSFLDINLRERIYSDDFKDRVKDSRSKKFIPDLFNSAESTDVVDRLLYVDIHSYLPGVILSKSDMSSMSDSLETRSPLLDHKFMELTAKLPSQMKIRGTESKYLLKKIALKYLPPECVGRGKKGFIPPLEHWLRSGLSGYISAELSDRKFLSYNIFNEERIENLIRDHMDYRHDNTYKLWTILCLKHWLEEWFN